MQDKIIYNLTKDNFPWFPILPEPGDRVFLRGDLGAGKTTLSKYFISTLLGEDVPVKSPTYMYYNKYRQNIYHFDLYRLRSYDDFVNIGGEEILDDERNICIIEWPELLAGRYGSTVDIEIRKTDREDEREVVIEIK